MTTRHAPGQLAPPRRRELTRARLVDAAEELFIERGSLNIPIEAICERAGFTRGAFYSSFSTTDDLLLAVFDARSRDITAELGRNVDAALVSRTAPQDVDQLATLLATLLPHDEIWFRLRGLFLAQTGISEDGRNRLTSFRNRQVEELEPLIVRALRSFDLRPTVPVETLVLALISAFEGASSTSIGMSETAALHLRAVTIAAVLVGITERTPE